MSSSGNAENINVISVVTEVAFTSDFKTHYIANSSKENLEKFVRLTVEEEQRSKFNKISLDDHCKKSDMNFMSTVYNYRNTKELGKSKMFDNPVLSFCDIIRSTPGFLEKHSVKKIYAFYGMNEIWVLTDKFSTEAIMNFNSDVYDVMESMQVDLFPMLIGIHEVSTENIPPYDLEVEV